MQINPAVILGAYINGLGTIHALSRSKVRIPIIVAERKMDGLFKSCGFYSKFVNERIVFDHAEQLISHLKRIHRRYRKKLVLYPTGTDYYFRLLHENYDELETFCYLPLNPKIAKNIMDKDFQHKIARELNIPVPRSVRFTPEDFLLKVGDLKLPIIVKALTRNRLDQKFRFEILNTEEDVDRFNKRISELGINAFQASEVIPGESDQLYTYGSYFNFGRPEGEFVGRKITQYPYKFGVVCI
ncbi:MAG: hypothetical protein ACTSVW_01030, partial [Candidatus Njordarchaeales archaeon]